MEGVVNNALKFSHGSTFGGHVSFSRDVVTPRAERVRGVQPLLKHGRCYGHFIQQRSVQASLISQMVRPSADVVRQVP